MFTQERIREWLTRKSVWAAACCLPVVILFVAAVSSQRHWQQRAAVLERQNVNLQLGQLAREVAREADDLIDRAHALAESELIARLAQDDSVALTDSAALVLGCAVGQGFLFARPMPADQCLEFLRDNADTGKVEDEDMLAVFSAAGRG
jgi:hypothetical protein